MTEIYSVINNQNQGTSSYRYVRRTALKSIVKDLLDLKLNLYTFNHLNNNHFDSLLRHWQAKGNSVSTIRNKKAILSWFLSSLGNKLNLPANSELQLYRDESKPYTHIHEELIHDIYHPYNRFPTVLWVVKDRINTH